MQNSFSKNSILTLLADFSMFVFGFLYLIIVARVLGPEGKGIYSLILLIPGLLMVLGSFGIESANVYFIGKDKYKTKDIVANSLILSFALGIILIIIFGIISQFNFFQNFIISDNIPIFQIWLVVLIIPIYFISTFFRNILRGYGNIEDYNKVKIMEGSVLLLTGVIFLLLFKNGIEGAVISYILSIFFAALFSIFLTNKIVKIFPLKFNSHLFKESLSFGLKVYLANALSFLNYRLDMFLIAIFLLPAQVGIYSLSVGIAEKLLIIPGALATVLFPKVSSISNIDANGLTSRISRHTTFIMIVICFCMIFLANYIIKLFFGDSFLLSVIPLLILLPGILAFSIGGVLAADLAGRGKPQFAVFSSLLGLVSNVILNIIFIPVWGIAGAALASSIAYWLDTLVILFGFSIVSKISLKEVLIIKKQDFFDYYNIFTKTLNFSKN